MTRREVALGYAALGIGVFPLKPGTKHPLGRLAPRGFLNASTDPDQVAAWWTAEPEANIGLVPGPRYLVVDIDRKAGTNGFATLEELAARHGDGGALAADVVVLTPHRGEHRWFAVPERSVLREGAGALGPGIDVRHQGGYVVAPPSTLPAGEYVFDGDGLLDGRAPGALPPWALAALTVTASGEGACARSNVVELPPHLDLADWELDELTSALDSLDPDMARPQWWRIAAALKSTNARQAFALWDEWSQRGAKYQPGETAYQWRHTRIDGGVTRNTLFRMALEAGWRCPADIAARKRAALGSTFRPGYEEAADADDAPADFDKIRRLALRPRDSAKLPTQLLDPPGKIGELARFVLARSYSPQPIFAVAAALTVGAALMARRYQTRTGLRTNLQFLLLGGSGSGKEHPLALVAEILGHCGEGHQVAGDEIVSGPAFKKRLARWPASFFPMDEMGLFLAQLAKSGGSAYHKADMLRQMMKAFSKTNRVWTGDEYAATGFGNRDGEAEQNARRDIHYCCPQVLGASTPKQFFDSITADEVANGFLPRFLVIQSDVNQPIENESCNDPEFPAALRDWGVALANPPTRLEDGNLIGSVPAAPFKAGYTPGALTLLRGFVQNIKRPEIERDGADRPLWARSHEHIEKIALVLAGGLDAGYPVVTEACVEYAIAFVTFFIRQSAQDVRLNVASSEEQRKTNQLVAAITKGQIHARSGQVVGMKFADVAKTDVGASYGSERALVEKLNSLVAAGRLRQAKAFASGGRPPRNGVYFAVGEDVEEDAALGEIRS